MTPLYMGWGMTVIMLIGAHALCDYPLQGPFLSAEKNPRKGAVMAPWYQAMGAHCAIHGAAVALVTGVWWLAVLEFAAHWTKPFILVAKRCGWR